MQSPPDPKPKRVGPVSRGGDLAVVALWAAGAACLLLCSEWLFLVTKPSMFSVMGAWSKVAVLLSSAFFAALLTAAGAAVLAIPRRLWPAGWPGWPGDLLAVLLPALILAATVLLLLENFTRTVFGFNVGSFVSPLRYLYAAGFLALTLYLAARLRRRLDGGPRWVSSRVAAATLTGLVVLSGAVALGRYAPRNADAIVAEKGNARPNIVILSSDGVRADHMSAYGYPRRTTPFLDSRIEDFLVSENHFTNAGGTSGSVSALLSGKLPTTTGVVEHWDSFREEHVFQHLPGVLRQLGYYGIELGPPVFAITYDRNLRQGFHRINSHRVRSESLPLLGWLGRAYPAEQLFAASILQRIGERLAHAFGRADMVDSYKLVTEGGGRRSSDGEWIESLKETIVRAPRPFFANVHLMDTHTPHLPREPFFSHPRNGGRTRRNRYDDVINQFDRWVEELVRHLESIDELEETVLIINSDHGIQWASDERLPLLIRFPHGEHRGRLTPNTQRIDIAPTILTYLGVEVPPWMEGESLIAGPLDPLRPIVSVGRKRSERNRLLTSVALTQCQQRFDLSLDGSKTITPSAIVGHTAPCPAEKLLSGGRARDYLLARLAGFDEFSMRTELGALLATLRLGGDPAERRRVTDGILAGNVQLRRLSTEIQVAHASQGLWTLGTEPAAVVVSNSGEHPLPASLAVGSGEGRPFPVRFYVEDGEQTHEYLFSRPGVIIADLAATPPGSDRLFIIWSEAAWTPAGQEQRPVGIRLFRKLDLDLDELLGGGRPDEYRQAARAILRGYVGSASLEDGVALAYAQPDLWTEGSKPAALAVGNDGGEPLRRHLVVTSGREREFPFRFFVADGDEAREYVFSKPGRQTVDLAAVAPRSERLYIVWSEQSSRPPGQDGRALGVRLVAMEPKS